MRVKAFKIRQFGKGEEAKPITLYITAMTVAELGSKVTIDRWSKNNRGGYQRPPDTNRIMSKSKLGILGYLLQQGGSFPTSILVNSRSGNLKFKSEAKIDENIEFGNLFIPDGEILYLIDGQHRMSALTAAAREDPAFKKYPVIISILALQRSFDEMLLFHIVNSRVKKIPTDLAVKHMQTMIEKVPNVPKWVAYSLDLRDIRKGTAASIVDLLAESDDSPWYGKIQYMGEDLKPEHITSDFTMETYIAKHVLSEATFELMDAGDIAELLMNYWGAIMDLYPEPFKEPDNYTLAKTPGIASLHRIFPTVYAYAIQKGDTSKNGFKKILSLLQEKTPAHPDADFVPAWTSEKWSLKSGPTVSRATSEKMFRQLADGLAKKISLGLKGREK